MANPTLDTRRILFKAKTTKRWWATSALLIVAAFVGYGLLLPKTYQASVLVLIHKPPISNMDAADTFRLGDVLDTIKQRLTNYPFLAEVARECNLDAGLDPKSKEYDILIKRMQDSVLLENSDNNEFFRISYEGYSPDEAYRVTNVIVKKFIKQSTEYYGSKAEKNVDFLKSQFNQAELDMADAQIKVRNYKDTHIDEIPEAQEEHMRRLASIEASHQDTLQEINGTSNALHMAMAQINAVPKMLSRNGAQPQDPVVAQLKSQQSALRMKLEMMTSVQGFTEQHWEVKSARKQLALVESQLTSATMNKSENVTVANLNPVYTDLQTKITSYQLRYGELQKQLVEQTGAIKELEAYQNKIPKHQDDLKTLERNYAMAAAQVEYFRGQLNNAQRVSDLESEGMGPSYDIKDPPRMPTSPSGPRLLKFVVFGVFLGGCASAGLILLLVLLDGSLRSIDEARGILRMPILGFMQHVVAPEQGVLRRRKAWVVVFVAVGVAALALIAVGAIGWHWDRDELTLALRKFMNRR